MEKIIVNQLGSLKNVELELKNLMVFYGDNTVGKSFLSKAIYFFKSFRLELQKFLIKALWVRETELSISAFNRLMRTKFLRLFGPTFGQKDINISYVFGDNYQITVGLKGKYVDFNFHKEFKEKIFDAAVRKLKGFFKELSNLKGLEGFDLKEEKRKFAKIISNEINQMFSSNRQILYFPAFRGIVSPFHTFNETEMENNSFLLFELLNYIKFVKRKLNKSLYDIELKAKQLENKNIDEEKIKLAQNLISALLKAKLLIDNSKDKLFYNDTNYVRFNFASASQQSLAYMLHIIYLWLIDKTPVFTVIEEPEISLSPAKQKLIVDFLALLVNISNQNQIIITTHSPFVMYELSNLLYANFLAKDNPQKVNEIVDKNLWIDKDKFIGFEFLDSGYTKLFENDFYRGDEFLKSFEEPYSNVFQKLFRL